MIGSDLYEDEYNNYVRSLDAIEIVQQKTIDSKIIKMKIDFSQEKSRFFLHFPN